jgi:integrase
MGRKKQRDTHLPRRMCRKHGAYYHTVRKGGKQVWTRLSDDYGQALRMWADLEGRSANAARTISDAMAIYIEAHGAELSSETIKGYRRSAERLAPVFGSMALGDLERAHIFQYLRKRGDIAANRDRALLSATYSFAINSGFFKGANPAIGMHYRNPEKARKRYVTDGELAALELAAHGRMKQLIRIAYLTGMRQGDVLALRLTDATESGISYTQTKTGKRIDVEWSDELRAAWRAAQGLRVGALPLFATRMNKDGSGGGHYTGDGFRAIWARIKVRAKVLDVTFHDLRRKAGSDVTDEQARALLGHEDARTTRRHYRARPELVKPVR